MYDGRFYTIGEGHKEFAADKQTDGDYYVLTLAAISEFSTKMKGVNMVVDVGNCTMNTMTVINGVPQQGRMFTEQFGTHQCTLAVPEAQAVHRMRQKTYQKTRQTDLRVDIFFTVVGMMSIPDEKEIQAMMEEMENHPKTLKYVP